MCLAQLNPSELGIDFEVLRKEREKLMDCAKAKNTIKAYNAAWKIFDRWCTTAKESCLPASSETVSLFVVWAIFVRAYRLNTVRSTLAAISNKHHSARLESPVSLGVRKLVSNAARKLREKRGGKRALTPSQLLQISQVADHGRTISIRDRAMFFMGFAPGWRRSEIVSLDLSDVHFTDQGIMLSLGASKTDQDGSEGRYVGIAYGENKDMCPVLALKRWIEVRGSWPGPLFCRVNRYGHVIKSGLAGDTVNDRIKLALLSIGEDPTQFGAHSLRSGFVTAVAQAGASEIAIMQSTGIKHMSTLLRYVRPARAFRANPMRGVL